MMPLSGNNSLGSFKVKVQTICFSTYEVIILGQVPAVLRFKQKHFENQQNTKANKSKIYVRFNGLLTELARSRKDING